MDKQIWNHQLWVIHSSYPKGTIKCLSLLSFLSTLLLTLLFCYHYPVYRTFYGLVNEKGKNVVTVAVPLTQIEEFEYGVLNDKHMEIQKIDSEIQYVSGKPVVNVEIIVSIDQKLLVENNIVVIRVKIKNMSIWKEISQKWKRGMKNETYQK